MSDHLKSLYAVSMRLQLFAALGLVSACAPAPSQAPTRMPDVVAQVAAPRDLARLRVVVIGDQGTGTAVQRRVAAAMAEICASEGCDLGVGLGDNFYPSGPRDPASPLFRERFAEVYGPLKVPFLMIPGNHDESWVRGGDGADPRGAEAQVAYSRINPSGSCRPGPTAHLRTLCLSFLR